MKLRRIGDKIVSEEKLFAAISDILDDRETGATQGEAATKHHVQRSFVSFLETLGEVRRGSRVAIIAFPVANAKEVRELGERYSVDLVLALSQDQREGIEASSGDSVFNTLIETMEELVSYDVLIACASDKRIASFKHILALEVVGIELGKSPIRHDVNADLEKMEETIKMFIPPEETDDKSVSKPRWAVGPVQRRAGEIVRRWGQ